MKTINSNLKSMDKAKASLRGKFIAIQAYLRKQEQTKNSKNLTLYLKEFGKRIKNKTKR